MWRFLVWLDFLERGGDRMMPRRMQARAVRVTDGGRTCGAHRIKREHGRSNDADGPARRILPAPPVATRTESLAGRARRRATGALPVLAGHPEYGRAGVAGPLSAVGAGLLLDPAQSDPDDGDTHSRLLAVV